MKLRETRTNRCMPDKVSQGWRIELMDAGKPVSRLWVVDRRIRIGGGEFRMGGIAAVGTDQAYRDRGLARRTMQAALELMKREGYPLSILHGIPDFYHRFGYACCLPDYELRVPLGNAKAAQRAMAVPGAASGRPGRTGEIRLRASRKADLPAIARMYNREQEGRAGSIVRDPRGWQGFPRSVGWFTKPGVRVAVDARDSIRGYFVYDAEAQLCRVSEIGGGPETFEPCMRYLARRAEILGKEEILFAMPPDHPFGRYCRGFGCENRIRYPRNGEFMGLILDRPAFMADLVKGLGLAPRIRALCARLEDAALLQLALGFKEASDLLQEGRLRATAEETRMLHRQFPPKLAHMSWADRF